MMSKRRSRPEMKAMIDAMVAWGVMEEHPDTRGPQRTRYTAFGHQLARFLDAPHEEPTFPAAWITAFERMYRDVLPRSMTRTS
jgi:hypothetical protein